MTAGHSPTYGGGMGQDSGKQRSADADRLATLLGGALAQGAEIVAAVRAKGAGGLMPSPEVRELERAHKSAVARHSTEVRAHQSRLRRAQRRVGTMTTTAAVAGTLALISGASGDGVSPGTAMLAAVTGAAALIAYRSRELVHNPPPEPTAVLPAPPPPQLRKGARGDIEAKRLLSVRAQLTALIPAVSDLHPGAGDELARADAEAGPALNALVARLAVLDQIQRSLPGSEAAYAATRSAEDVRLRLVMGVETYDRLMAAAAAMLAAPDIGRSSEDVLGPAIDALEAYAHGLTVSSETFTTDVG